MRIVLDDPRHASDVMCLTIRRLNTRKAAPVGAASADVEGALIELAGVAAALTGDGKLGAHVGSFDHDQAGERHAT